MALTKKAEKALSKAEKELQKRAVDKVNNRMHVAAPANRKFRCGPDKNGLLLEDGVATWVRRSGMYNRAIGDKDLVYADPKASTPKGE